MFPVAGFSDTVTRLLSGWCWYGVQEGSRQQKKLLHFVETVVRILPYLWLGFSFVTVLH